jgi:uncharacterized protein YggE
MFMPRFLAALVLSAFATAPALAQVSPEGVRLGNGPGTTTHGITVTGTASARVPASSARIALTVTTRDRSLSLDTQSLAPVVDAIVKAGADPSSVHLPPNFAVPGGSNIATITATVEHPTIDQMQQGIVSVGTVIASQKNMLLANAQVQLIAANCESAIDEARARAVKQARAKAESLAQDLGVHIGAALNVSSFDQLGADGGCSSTYYVNGGFNPQGPLTPNDYVTVQAATNVTVTYTIK